VEEALTVCACQCSITYQWTILTGCCRRIREQHLHIHQQAAAITVHTGLYSRSF